MSRLSFIELVCIVAIGIAMVEVSAGHRFFRMPEALTVSAPGGPVASADGAAPSPVDLHPRPSEGRR
jgi:hypothetical protein